MVVKSVLLIMIRIRWIAGRLVWNYRRSKYEGISGIIAEHAFIDNVNDAEKLKDESFLKQCGVADATGIANHFDCQRTLGVGWKSVEV